MDLVAVLFDAISFEAISFEAIAMLNLFNTHFVSKVVYE